jgi:phenylalanyl-tRNA synthetase beta chain
LPAETVRGTIRAAAPETLVSVREFDRYQGKGVPEGRVSLSLRLTFRSLERTLTDAEVETAMKKILDALKDAHSVIQR